jgi:hypothetical protein
MSESPDKEREPMADNPPREERRRAPLSGAERDRLAADAARRSNWKRWGSYLSQRQWGTVREDYSADGEAWKYFTHEHARSRAYRWGEDGLLGICDREQRLCFAPAFWNGRDPILKERLFGLIGLDGNHGEDVKECYFYLDALPSHAWMKALYKYPQAEFPYRELTEENLLRGPHRPEYEIIDTGVFDNSEYFDIIVEYAKESPNDILIRYRIANRGPRPATLHFLPTIWFRNTWSWGRTGYGYWPRPSIVRGPEGSLQADHATLGRFRFAIELPEGGSPPEVLFTGNETNSDRLFGTPNRDPYVKDAFHEYVVHGRVRAVNRRGFGTKAAFYTRLEIPAGGESVVRLRLYSDDEAPQEGFGPGFDRIFDRRKDEADAFYAEIIPQTLPETDRRTMRHAYAGLLWSKQFYHYIVEQWLEGDPTQPKPPESRLTGRNHDWTHFWSRDVLSMPDNWEYPWFALWDLCFHMIPLARIDPDFAKGQLVLLLREWYMHPAGQEPAYEFDFSDVNPPVHAWAGWRVYKVAAERGKRDRTFLARIFQENLFDFSWWLNRKDIHGRRIFSGGFLGLDNIGAFDRSHPAQGVDSIDQADATAWMAFYCATMLSIALELAVHEPAYEDTASKFFEHFVSISAAINTLGGTGLWDEEDGFYYDQIHVGSRSEPLRLRSIAGFIPLIAVEVIDAGTIDRLPGFAARMQWFLANRRDAIRGMECLEANGRRSHDRWILALPSRDRLLRVLRYLLDENEFLSPYGIRSLSKAYMDRPFVFNIDGKERRVTYAPGESDTRLFGGNSNWRGPIWFPINYLICEALERYYYAFGDDLKVECPTGSGRMMNLGEVSREIGRRLRRIFEPDGTGLCPFYGGDRRFAEDPHWRELIWFFECFDAETGRGVGASHQTGWTALITRVLEDASRDI